LDGFLTEKKEGEDVTFYDYSSRGELLRVDLPDGRVIEYIHDPLGRRIAKKVNGVITQKYLWQGLIRLLAVYDGSDNLLMRFEYADARIPVSMTMGGSTYYLSYDQVGSLQIVMDSGGNIVKRIDYDSFGNIISDSNPTFYVPFGFAGGLHDRDTGLVRFGFRDFDPDIGRWAAKDTLFFKGGSNYLYEYCFNDPVNWFDPKGESLVLTVISIGMTVIGVYHLFKLGRHIKKNSEIAIEKRKKEVEFDEMYENCFPDITMAEELSVEIDELRNEGLNEIWEGTREAFQVPLVSSCPPTR
jgi:RHS repeat-associated protein